MEPQFADTRVGEVKSPSVNHKSFDNCQSYACRYYKIFPMFNLSYKEFLKKKCAGFIFMKFTLYRGWLLYNPVLHVPWGSGVK